VGAIAQKLSYGIIQHCCACNVGIVLKGDVGWRLQFLDCRQAGDQGNGVYVMLSKVDCLVCTDPCGWLVLLSPVIALFGHVW